MAMKLHFENPYTDDRLDYQRAAIEAACGLFRGQEVCRTEFTVVRDKSSAQQTFEYAQSDLGIGNRLQLLDDEVLANLSDIQVRNGLSPSSTLASGDFTVEMETGTGKTYVYLRTIYEMRRRYGWGKFIIVVPSIAIYEGVIKTFEITRSHFGSLYGNEHVNLIRYEGNQLSRLRSFAMSTFCEVLIITLDSFNKANNVIYRTSEKLPGERKPYHFVQETRPIVILDEPQNMESQTARSAI